MGNRSIQHEQVVKALLAYMEGHLQDDFSIADLAKYAGYSVAWIDRFFKRETGESPFERLLKMRVDRAKGLLLDSDLSITEIAYDVGFNSHNRFSVMFKKQEGLTPTEFRQKARISGELPVFVRFQPSKTAGMDRVRFHESFAGSKLEPDWKKAAGQWWIQEGELFGKAEESLQLTFCKPLPENFEISFDFCFLGNPPLRLFLNGGDASASYLTAEIGNLRNGTAMFIFPHLDHFWSHNAFIVRSKWQKLSLKLIDNSTRIAIDGVEVLNAQDPFPPPYPLRSRFEIGGWQSELKIRNFVVRDFGFSATVPAVRQADMLFRNGLHDRALDCYLRLLEYANEPADIAELQFKIGMCCLRQRAFVQSYDWFSKVADDPENNFWFHSARNAILETFRAQRDDGLFLQHAKSIFATDGGRNAVRTGIDRAKSDLSAEGYFERALSCVQVLWILEQPGSLNWVLAEMSIPDLLFNLRRYTEQEELLQAIISDPNLPTLHWAQANINLADAFSYSGNFAGSEKVLDQVRDRSARQYDLALCEIIHGVNLRGQQRFDEAIQVLKGALDRFPQATNLGVFASLMASNILCLLDRPTQAGDLIRNLENRFPGNTNFAGFHASSFLYPPLLLQMKHGEAAEILLAGSRQGGLVYQAASQMVRAGILFELGKDANRAAELWSEVTRRFPLNRCCFFAELARSFMGLSSEVLEAMPYPAFDRAEMFYLAGLLYWQRNDEENAQKYFRLAVADDPTLNWFTCRAKDLVVADAS